MPYKEIICLANSRKNRKHCIAGKEVGSCEWIRPISSYGKGVLADSEIKYANGSLPEVLDIMRIPYKKDCPNKYQPENILISKEKWERLARFKEEELDKICDNPKDIWMVDDGRTDRIPADFFKSNKLDGSLLLIRIKSLEFQRYDYQGKPRLRGIFEYNNIQYNIVVTDLVYEAKYSSQKIGFYKLNAKKIYLCISLGEPYDKDNYCYKFIAAIIAFN